MIAVNNRSPIQSGKWSWTQLESSASINGFVACSMCSDCCCAQFAYTLIMANKHRVMWQTQWETIPCEKIVWVLVYFSDVRAGRNSAPCNPKDPWGFKRQDRDSSPACCRVHLLSWPVPRRRKYGNCPWPKHQLSASSTTTSSIMIMMIMIIMVIIIWWSSSAPSWVEEAQFLVHITCVCLKQS